MEIFFEYISSIFDSMSISYFEAKNLNNAEASVIFAAATNYYFSQ